MRRFYIPPSTTDNPTAVLDRDESKHITKVLRLQPNTAIELYDGTGFLYQASITAVNKTVTVQIHSKEFFNPPTPALILHAGLLKNKKMELVLQKATELGVSHVHLFTSDYTSGALPDTKKLNRYNKIIQESCKQCERIHPMTVTPPTPLQEQLKNIEIKMPCYLFWEQEEQNTPHSNDITNVCKAIHIFTGPEGGFSEDEIAALPQNIKTVSLGKQILRAETAVIASISIVAFLAGRLNP